MKPKSIEIALSKISAPINSIEVHPVKIVGKTQAGSYAIEQVESHEEADFWTVYVHYVKGGLDAILDCPTKHEADELKGLIDSLIKNYENDID